MENIKEFIAEEIHIGSQDFASMKNIMLCGDSNYIKYIGVTLSSIVFLDKGKNKNTYAFHIICDTVTDYDLEKLRMTSELYGCSINIYFLNTAVLDDLTKSVNDKSHVNVAALFRIIGFSILPKDVKNILYLDSDVLISDNLDSFWNIDLKDSIAAVVTDVGHYTHELRVHVQQYFNSGVIFIDITKWNKLCMLAQAFNLLFNGTKWRFPDQDVLNIIWDGKLLFLSPKYNYMYRLNYTPNNVDLNGEKPIIYHFIGISKPWSEWTQSFEVVKKYSKAVKHSCWNDNQLTKIDDVNNLWVKYKIYQTMCRGAKKHKEYFGYIVNLFWYCFYKVKYVISR